MLGIPWTTTLVVAAAYIAASEGAMHLLRVAADAPMISIASGVGLAALLHSGIRAAAGVFLGALLYALLSGATPGTALAGSLFTTAVIAAAWWLLQRLGVNPRLERLRDVLLLILIGATVIPLAHVARFALLGEWSPGVDGRHVSGRMPSVSATSSESGRSRIWRTRLEYSLTAMSPLSVNAAPNHL